MFVAVEGILAFLLVLVSPQDGDAVRQLDAARLRVLEIEAEEGASPGLADAERELAVALIDLGRYDEVLEHFARALDIRRTALGRMHPDTGASLIELAWFLTEGGALDEAESHYAEALAVFEATLGEEHPETARALDGLARVLKNQARYAESLPLYERALRVNEASFGPMHPETALSLNNLADLHATMGDVEESLAMYRRSLEICEATLGPEHPDTAASMANLGAVYGEVGDEVQARALLERALVLREKIHGSDHPRTAVTMRILSELYVRIGEYEPARRLAERSLEVMERAFGPVHPETASSANTLARYHDHLGDPREARRLYTNALEAFVATLGEEHPETVICMSNLAVVHYYQGDLLEARRLIEYVLAVQERVFGPDHPLVAGSLCSLAEVVERGDPVRAMELYERALSIYTAATHADPRQIALTQMQMGLLHFVEGRHALAEELHRRALELAVREYGPDYPLSILGMGYVAQTLSGQGRLEEARPFFEASIERSMRVNGRFHIQTNALSSIFGMVLRDLGEPRRAWELGRVGFEGLRVKLEAELGAQTESEQFSGLSEAYLRLGVLLDLARGVDDREVRVAAYEAVLFWKGRLVRTMTATREQLARATSPKQAELQAALRHSQSRLSTLFTDMGGVSGEASDRGDDVELLLQERRSLEVELQLLVVPTLEAEARRFADLAERLPENGAVVDFLVVSSPHTAAREGDRLVRSSGMGTPRLNAWIVRHGAMEPTRLDLGPAGVIGGAVETYVGALRSAVGGEDARGILMETAAAPIAEAGAALVSVLWDPLAPHLEGADWICISPDAFLGALPFETLPGEDGRHLVESRTFLYQLDLASILRSAPARVDAPPKLLTVGGVSFGSGEGGSADSWAPLPATVLETRGIQALHERTFEVSGERLHLTGDAPTETRLKSTLADYDVLHLATHGFLRPEGMTSLWETARGGTNWLAMPTGLETRHLSGYHPGLLTGLVCAAAGKADGANDGYLTAEEVGWLDLTGAELVVLSACETALGRARTGEGMIGLRRAFHAAGAETVISSLWAVKDRSTAELMGDFYANLWTKGMGRLEALREAQLAMLRRNRAEHGQPLPSTWGAFVLSGEWR